MTEIKVVTTAENDKNLNFEVEVKEGESKTTHLVAMTRSFYESLQTKSSPDTIVKKSFEFLLTREPKDSILSSFEITDISKYFPEFSQKVKGF